MSERSGWAGAHLARHRPLILGRSVAAGAVGLVPLPVLDELLAGAVRAELLRQVAAGRQVDVDESAIAILAETRTGEALPRASRVALDLAALKRAFRKLALALHLARRLDEVAGTFAVATLFDHYCARHHRGLGVDTERAGRLRRTIEAAIGDARGALVRQGFGATARGAGRLARRVLAGPPRALLRLAGRGEGPLAPETIEPEAARRETRLAASGRGSLVRRGMDRLGGAASLLGERWIEELLRAFDQRWASEEA